MKGFIELKCYCCGTMTVNIAAIGIYAKNEHNKLGKMRVWVRGAWHETNYTKTELEALITAAQA